MSLDPVTREVVRNACVAVAEEMSAALVRTAYSPNIKDRRDSSCALFDAGGEMVSQAENIPMHLGSLPFAVRAVLDRFGPDGLAPGDAVLLNDPYHGGAHLPDLTLVTPVFVGGDLVAFAVSRAHHTDVGGSRPGSWAPDTTEIYQEGLRIPPVKLFEAGEEVGDVMSILLSNTRTPDERRGDVRAQRAANETGRRRVVELAERYGADRLRAAFEGIKGYSERRVRAAIADLPSGTESFECRIDDDGHGNRDLPIRATVTIRGDDIVVDFEGTAPQAEGPINCVLQMTAAATYYAIRCVTDPDLPSNSGSYRPVDIRVPEGSLLDASPPAPVVSGHETAQQVAEAVLGAVGRVAPERVPAGSHGTTNGVLFGGTDPRSGDPYTFYETEAGGFGGRAGHDGMDGVHVHTTNTRNTPVESLETAYPLRVRRYEFRADSGGAGRWRGGLGLRRDIEVHDHAAEFCLVGNRRRHSPHGLAGGEAGQPGEDFVLRDGERIALAPNSYRGLEPGDVVSVRTPGGGGYGDPDERDPEAIARDVRLGKVSPDAARSRYGDRAPDPEGDGGRE